MQSYQDYWTRSGKVVSRYFYAFFFIAAIFIGFLILEEKYKYLFALMIPAIMLITVTQPRLAVYQFIFIMFSNIEIFAQPIVLLNDLSALILVVTALFDLLLKDSFPQSFPKLILNFIIIIAALFLSAVFGNNMALVVSPIIRIIFIILTFLSLYRLSGYFEIKHLIKVFFWFGLIHAFIAMMPYLTSREVIRVFGFSRHTLDDYMMISFPIGLTFYLWSEKEQGIKYLIASVFMLITLIATQSRLPIIFTIVLSGLVIYFSIKLSKQEKEKRTLPEEINALNISHNLILSRIKFILMFAVFGVVAMFFIVPDIVGAAWHRFERLLNLSPVGTFRIRLILWQTALTAFWANPVLGIGPGYFKHIHNIYNFMHFNMLFMYVRNLSAHNMFLHYLAETGLVGTTVVVALFINQFRIGKTLWKNYRISGQYEVTVILFVISLLFLFSIFIEAGWLWGQVSYLFVFFITLIVHSVDRLKKTQ